MKKTLFAFVLAVTCLNSGCAAPWWEQPPQEEGKVFAVGTVIKGRNLGASRTFAEADARGKLGAYIGTQVQALTEVYNGTGGEAGLPEAAPSFFNNESIIRTLTNTRLMGAKTLKYANDEKYYYVLMELDMAQFTDLWKKTLEAEAAKQKYLESKALKEAYSNKLDKTLEQYKKKPEYQNGDSIDNRGKTSNGTTVQVNTQVQ